MERVYTRKNHINHHSWARSQRLPGGGSKPGSLRIREVHARQVDLPGAAVLGTVLDCKLDSLKSIEVALRVNRDVTTTYYDSSGLSNE